MTKRLTSIYVAFMLAVVGFAFSSFVDAGKAYADQPTVTYSTTTPAPGQQVTATLAGSPTVSDLQWQWSSNAISWGNAGETGNQTVTLTVPDKPGFKFRYTWVRNGVREYATTHVTVTDETITYSTTTPAPGEQVTATLSGGTSGVTYQWQWSYDGNAWGNAGETGYDTDTFTVPNKPGLKFRLSWTRNSIWKGASSYVTVTAETVSYSTTTPEPNSQVKATLSGDTTGVTYRWQWSIDGHGWGNAGETGYNTDTLTVPNKPGFKFRLSWTRNGVRQYASSHITVTATVVAEANVDYSTTTPVPGERVTATVSGDTNGIAYRWQWSSDGRAWGNAGETGNDTDTITVPNKPGFKFRLSWTLNSVRSYASSYVTVTPTTVTYSSTTPDAGSQVTATLGNTNGVTSYRWQWSYDGRAWGNAGETGNNTDTITLPNKPGFKFRISWVQNGFQHRASSYITVARPAPPTVSYSTTTPVPGQYVTATLNGNTSGVTAYQWQWSSDGSTWKDANYVRGNTTDTLRASSNPGYRFRISWTRYNKREYASSYVTVARSIVSYSDTTPAKGSTVTVTVSPGTGLTYQWLWSADGKWWGYSTDNGNDTDTLTIPYVSGRKYIASWTRNGIRESASTYVTVP